MSKAYGIDDEMAIAARAEMAVTGLTSGTVSDADATRSSAKCACAPLARTLLHLEGVLRVRDARQRSPLST